jgi:hypothetical protein
MEPIKKLKKHHVTKVEYDESLWQELSNLFESNNTRNRGFTNWIITSPELAKIINNMDNENRG